MGNPDGLAIPFVLGELLGSDVAMDGRMAGRRAEILADGDYLREALENTPDVVFTFVRPLDTFRRWAQKRH
jgi:hypothetical protein